MTPPELSSASCPDAAAELAVIRGEIWRLQAREQQLRALLRALAEPAPLPRPGWPIRRAGQNGALH